MVTGATLECVGHIVLTPSGKQPFDFVAENI